MLELAWVADCIATREHAGATGGHVKVDFDVVVGCQLYAPLLEVVQIGGDADVDDGQVGGNIELLAVLGNSDGLNPVGAVDGYQVGVHDLPDVAVI